MVLNFLEINVDDDGIVIDKTKLKTITKNYKLFNSEYKKGFQRQLLKQKS